jgi:hypothetical protein
MIGVGDIIVRKGGGEAYRVKAVLSGSWSGDRYYDCAGLDNGRERFLYDDEVKLMFRAEQRQSAD